MKFHHMTISSSNGCPAQQHHPAARRRRQPEPIAARREIDQLIDAEPHAFGRRRARHHEHAVLEVRIDLEVELGAGGQAQIDTAQRRVDVGR